MKRCLRIVSALIISYFAIQNMLFAQSTSCSNPIQVQIGTNSQSDKDSIYFYEYTATMDGTIEISTCGAPAGIYPYIDMTNTFDNDCATNVHNIYQDICSTGQSIFKLQNCLKGHKYVFGIQSWDYTNLVPVAFNWTLNEYVTPPTAVIYYGQYSQSLVGKSLEFQNNSYNNDKVNCSWDFGDGTILNACDMYMYHSYTMAGDYNVILTVYNGTLFNKDTVKVSVIDPFKSAINIQLGTNFQNVDATVQKNGGQFYTYTATSTGKLTLSFCNSPQTVNYGVISYYNQNGVLSNLYPSSNLNCSISSNSEYTYMTTKGQQYYFFISCIDNQLLTQTSFSWNFNEEILPPLASINYYGNLSVLPNTSVAFNNYSTNYDVNSVSWILGDGTTSTNSGNVSAKYSQPGFYTTMLTVKNGTLSSTASKTIKVINPQTDIIQAVQGDNLYTVSSSSQNYGFYYRYKATTNGKITVSLCNVGSQINATVGNNLYTIDASGNFNYSYYSSYKNCSTNLNYEYSVDCSIGQEFAFYIYGSNVDSLIAPNFMWNLSETTMPPVANLQLSGSTTVSLGSYVTVSNYSQYYESGKCTIDFGDGTIVNSCSTESHNYISPGKYNIVLTVYNGSLSASATTQVTVIDIVSSAIQAQIGSNAYNLTIAQQGNGVYYYYTPTVNGHLNVSMCNVDPQIYAYVNTFLSGDGKVTYSPIYKQCPVNGTIYSLDVVAGQKVIFNVNASMTIGTGTLPPFNWDLSEIAYQPGEMCSMPINANVGTNTFTVPTIMNSSISKYFSYTPSIKGHVVISLCGSSYSSLSNIKLGDCMSNQNFTQDTCSNGGTLIYRTNGNVGQELRFMISGGYDFNMYKPSPFTWTISEEPMKAGEDCSTALQAQSGNNTFIASNTSSNVYYTYIPTSRSKVVISFCGVSSNISVNVFDIKSSCNSTNSLMFTNSFCSNNQYIYTIDAQPNQPIYFGVNGFDKQANKPANFIYNVTEVPYKDGEICDKPIVANNGVNTFNFVPGNMTGTQQYYTYTAKEKGRIILSFCDLPDTIFAELNQVSHSQCPIYSTTGNTDYINVQRTYCGTHVKALIECNAGEQFYFPIYGSNTFNWTLNEIPILQGEECSNPIVAKKGVNLANWQFNASAWYVYTAPANGAITVSNCGNTYENTSVLITNGCNMQMLGYNNDSCNLQSQKSIQVEAGKQYYIWWFKENNNNNGGTSIFQPTAFEWNLDFSAGKILPNGGSCSAPIPAKSVNPLTSTPGGIVWYSYTATQTGKAAISLKRDVLKSNLQLDIKSMKNCMIFNGNDDLYLNFEDTSAYIYATKGETYQFAFMFGSTNTTSITFDWYLSEVAQTIPSGAVCSLAKKIKTGNYFIADSVGRDWYNFTAPTSGTLYLKYSPINNNQNSGIFSIMDNCDGNQVTSTNSNGELSYHMNISEAKYILYNNTKNKSNISWQLEFIPDNDVSINNIVIYGMNNGQVMAQPAIIDPINKTIVIKVGNQVNISQPFITTINVDKGVRINNIAGMNYYDNIQVTYNNPTAITVSSPDGMTNVTWNVSLENLKTLHSSTKIVSFTVGGQSATLIKDSIFVATLDWSIQNTYLSYTIVADTMVSMQFSSGTMYSPQNYGMFNIDRPDTTVVYTVSEDGTKQDRYIFIVKRGIAPVGGLCSNAISLVNGSNTVVNNSNSSVWSTYTATSDAFIQIAYPNSQWASIGQFSGTDCSQMYNANWNDINQDKPFVFRANKGITYYFQVHSSLPNYVLTVSETKARTGNDITNISISSVSVIQQYIDTLNNKISITVPYGAPSTMYAYLQASDGASIMIGTSPSNNLSLVDGNNPFTVVAENGTIAYWNFIVNRAPANSEANFLSFILPEQVENPIIDLATQKINVKVDASTIVAKSIPYFIVSNGATAYIDGIQQLSGSSTVDFTTAVTYVVISEDQATKTYWTVSISGGITDIPVSYISFPQQLITIDEGQTITIEPIITPVNATTKTLSWTHDNSSVISINGICNPCSGSYNATISALAPGYSTLKVTAVNGVSNSIAIQVNPKITRVKGIVLNTHILKVSVGEKYQFSASVIPTDATYPTVIWQASNKNISFDQTGTISADIAGSTTLYAISADNKAILDSCIIAISTKYIALMSVDIVPVELKMNVNSTATPQVNFTPTNFASSDLMWWSDDPTIAIVDANGVITTTSRAGQAKIYAGSATNTTIYDVVLVTSSIIPVTGITLSQQQVSIEVGQSANINVASFMPTTATNLGCTWSLVSGTMQIARIDKQSYTSCSVSGLIEGKATLIATSLDGNAVASCIIYVLPVSVKSISITPSIVNTFVGDVPFTITSSILPTNASNQSVVITNSSANKVTYIMSTGQIKPIALGIDTIKIQSVSNPAVFATCVVTVNASQIPLTSIQFVESMVQVNTASSYQLICGFDPANATNKDVVFASSDVSIATVSQSGIITTSKIVGKAYIYVTSATNKLIGDTLLLYNTSILASSVNIDSKNLVIPLGGSARINAYIAPTNVTNTTVTWKVLESGIVSVQSSGNLLYVTGLKKGTARIVASIDNVTDTCYVQITPIMIQSVGLNATALSMKIGDVKQIQATFTPSTAENTTLVWSSSSPSVATIDINGNITATSVGTTTISVSPQTNQNLVASCIVTVSSSEIVLTQIAIVDADLTTKLDVIKVDALSKKQLFIAYTPIDATYKDIVWSSSSSLTTVDVSGIIVTGNVVDTAIITAMSVKYSTVIAKVKVITTNIRPIQVSSIVIESQVSVNINETRLLKRDVLPTTATNKVLNWISSNPNVVTVDKNGTIKGVNPGFAIIYAQATDFQATKSNECFVIVNEVPVTGITINVNGVLTMKENTVDNSIMATILPSNATNKKLLWVSSNSGSVVVDTVGTITALKSGIAIIYAISKSNPSVRDSFIVEVTKPLADKSVLATLLLDAKAKLTFINDNSLTGIKPGQYPTTAVLAFYNASLSAKVVYEKILASQFEVDSTSAALKLAFVVLENSKIGYTAVTSLSIIRDSVIIKINETASYLKAYLSPETATIKSVNWNSTNANIVDIDANGLLIPRNPGVAYVYAKSIDNAQALDSCKIIVIAPVQQIVLPSIFSLVNGETNSIPFTVIPENATNQELVWSISDTSFAINDNNMISAKKVGYAKVIVSTVDKSITAVCVLAITSSQIPVTGITVQPKVALLNGTSIAIKASVSPIDATNQNIYWSIANQDVATINEYGVVTANSVGTTELFAISEDGNFVDTSEVSVYPSLSPVIVGISSFNIKTGTDGITFDLARYIADDNTTIENLKISVAKLTGFTYDLTGTILSIIPKPSFTSGTETVSISVTDRDGQTTTVTFKVTVSNLQNTAPIVANIPSQQIKSGDVFSPIILTQFVSDDYTPVDSIIWTIKSSADIAGFVSAGYAKFELLNTTFSGTDSLWIIATDAGGLKDSVHVGFTVSKAVNTAPKVIAIPTQTQNATSVFGLIDLTKYVTDDYTLPSNIKWTTSVSTKLNISIVNNIAYVAVIDQNWMGGESIIFTATDENGLSADTNVTFNQELNMSSSWPTKPLVNFYAENQVVGVGEAVSFHSSLTGAKSWIWDFESGTTPNLSKANPEVTYTKPGNYSVKLYAQNTYGLDSLVIDQYISVVGIMEDSIIICKGNSATIHTSTSGLGYKWSNSLSTQDITVTPSSTSTYSVTISNGLFKYYDNVVVKVKQPVDLGADIKLCTGETKTVKPLVIAGTTFVSYKWNSTSVNSSLSVTTGGTYSLTATDDAGCITSDVIIITENALPTVSLGATDSICPSSPKILNAGTGLTSYLWSTGASTQTITVSATGIYSVTVTDANSCLVSNNVTIVVRQPYAEQLGVASIIYGTNKIALGWMRTSGKDIKSYEVLKESTVAGKYNVIGTRLYADTTYIVDKNADPMSQTYKYKLQTTNNCGDTITSKTHRTILLQAVYSESTNSNQLSWNAYEGINLSTYHIYRNGTDIKQIAASSSSLVFNDLTGQMGDKYYIGYDLPQQIVTDRLKSDSGPYSQSLSNMAESQLTSISINDLDAEVTAYPNPSDGKFMVKIESAKAAKYTVMLSTLLGQEVYSTHTRNTTETAVEIDVTGIANGLYLLKIESDGTIITKSIMINK
jgi:uncharacterized protein YjdB/PKD repeat protein